MKFPTNVSRGSSKLVIRSLPKVVSRLLSQMSHCEKEREVTAANKIASYKVENLLHAAYTPVAHFSHRTLFSPLAYLTPYTCSREQLVVIHFAVRYRYTLQETILGTGILDHGSSGPGSWCLIHPSIILLLDLLPLGTCLF